MSVNKPGEGASSVRPMMHEVCGTLESGRSGYSGSRGWGSASSAMRSAMMRSRPSATCW